MPAKTAKKIPELAYAVHPVGAPVPDLGAAHEGGFVGAVIPWPGAKGAIVVVSDKTQGGDMDPLEWDPKYRASPGATSFLDGLANTESVNDNNHPFAKAARAYRGGDFDDWQVPAHAVQTALLANLCPLWTAVDAFKEGAPQAYEKAAYWSSTQSQFGSSRACYQYFGLGRSGSWVKDGALRVRPVRIIVIQ